MPRFQKLALTAVVATYLMVVIGVVVRSTGSGMGCPDWPLCHGQLIPSLGDSAAWIEWVHRGWGVIVGLIVLALVVEGFRTQRATPSLVVGSVGALVLTGFQAWLGKVTVETGNSGESVTAHLATAMLLLAALIFVAVRAGYPARMPRAGSSQRLTLVVAFATACVYALLLFGAHVTSTGAALVYPDWPLFGGNLIPSFSSDPTLGQLQASQFVHRLVAAIVGVILLATAVVLWRAARASGARARGMVGGAVAGPAPIPGADRLLALVGTAAAIYAIQMVVGALQIWTTLDPWAVTLHLALGAAIWGLLAAATFDAWYAARSTEPGGRTAGTSPTVAGRQAEGTAAPPAAAADARTSTMSRSATRDDSVPAASRPRGVRATIGAFVALTKPRIIELLLVTTLPAMVLAWRTVEDLDPAGFAWLAVWTLVGGSLAAGAANAVNCYFDRDIDGVMARTRRRPLPAERVGAEDALVFGLALAVASFALLAVTTNLVAAFLTLLAVAFYVVVYTLLLKRSTPQNIVLGGAAGALPPVIGWAAVTGDITLPALLLFAVVFYWTPPHFWALSLRIRGDYEAARVPMLPVTHGVPETTRHIALYAVLMVALTLVFFAVARMGLVFLAGALLLGGLFLGQAFAMWHEGSDRRAVRLYKFSITYLTGLFALIVLDVAVAVAIA
jgi:protoheme IX farnesyltransferase